MVICGLATSLWCYLSFSIELSTFCCRSNRGILPPLLTMPFVLHTLYSGGCRSMLFTSPVLNKKILEGCIMGCSSEKVPLSQLFKSSPSHSAKISANTLQGNTTQSKTVTSNHPFTLGHPYWETTVSKAPPWCTKQVKLIIPSLYLQIDICRHIIPSC